MDKNITVAERLKELAKMLNQKAQEIRNRTTRGDA